MLTMSIPTGFILDENQRKSLISAGFNVWVEKNDVIFFFEKVNWDLIIIVNLMNKINFE